MPLPTPEPGAERPAIYRWIKAPCGRAKYAELASRTGALATLRLAWFVLIAALRDWNLADPEQTGGSDQPGAPGS
ncbi:MAG: hypothetical protein ACNA8O_06390 [Cyanobacteriota bacterium]|jgi:hypothetical protein